MYVSEALNRRNMIMFSFNKALGCHCVPITPISYMQEFERGLYLLRHCILVDPSIFTHQISPSSLSIRFLPHQNIVLYGNSF